MSYLKIFISFIVLLSFLTGCGKHQWWPGIDSAKMCEQQKNLPLNLKFKQEGHVSTTHLIAIYAGQKPISAERYALFSQAPDELAIRFSAPVVSIWATFLPWDWSYRKNINAILHSLHGGKTDEVLKRREKLSILIKKYLNSGKCENDWKIGFLIHALGDSYAHVYFEYDTNAENAYGPTIGHLCQKGPIAPDSIRENINNYMKYLDTLFDILKTDRANELRFKNYKAVIRRAVNESSKQPKPDEYVANQIAKHNKLFYNLLSPCKHEEWASEIDKSKVEDFLEEVSTSL